MGAGAIGFFIGATIFLTAAGFAIATGLGAGF